MGRRAATVLLAAVAAVGCDVAGMGPDSGPSKALPGEIPFELAGPGGMAVVVPVRLDGKGPYDFAVDTGATFTCVDQALADEVGLKPRPGTVGFGAGVGGSGALRVVSIDALEVGDARASDLPAAVIDLSNFEHTGVKIRGLVGLNFLKQYRVTFDFGRKVLSLRAPGGPQ